VSGPIVLRQQAHAEFTDDGILVLFPNGDVNQYATPAAAFQRIKQADERTARMSPAGRKHGALVVTEITWHNCPDGFDPEALA
jgi:hypothetical protein